jgi:hypothetical protein
MSKLITRKYIVVMTAILLLVAAVVVAAILDTRAAVVSLKSSAMSQEQFQNDVKARAEASTGMQVTRVGCGSLTATKWECFVTFVDQKESIVTVMRFQKSIAVNSISRPRPPEGGAR